MKRFLKKHEAKIIIGMCIFLAIGFIWKWYTQQPLTIIDLLLILSVLYAQCKRLAEVARSEYKENYNDD